MKKILQKILIVLVPLIQLMIGLVGCEQSNLGFSPASSTQTLTLTNASGAPISGATLWTPSGTNSFLASTTAAPGGGLSELLAFTDASNGATCSDPPQAFSRAACSGSDGRVNWLCTNGVSQSINVFYNNQTLAPLTFTCNGGTIVHNAFATPTPTPTPTPALTGIYVTNNGSNRISAYELSDNSTTIAPKRSIVGAATLLNQPRAFAVANGEIFVGTNGGSTFRITVFKAWDDGNVAPLRTIEGGATTLQAIRGLTVANGEIFVGISNAILVFNTTDSGNVAPKRTITGGSTTLSSIPYYLTVSGGELFVAQDSTSVLVFNATANGDVAPIRTISGSNVGFSNADGMAILGNELFVTDRTNNAIKVFSKTDNGNVSPIRTLSGAATGNTGSVAVSILNNEMYVVNFTGTQSIRVFNVTDNGNVAPLRVIEGTNALFSAPLGIVAVP